MRLGLVESDRARERQARGMASSVVVHAVVIGLACYGTLGAHVVHPAPEIIESGIPWPPLQAPRPVPGRRGSGPGSGRTRPPTIPPSAPAIPVGPVAPTAPPVAWESLVASPNDWGTGRGTGTRPGPADGDGGVFRTVDVMAVPDARNPAPVYPSMLSDAGIEGSVTAQFVVDSTGRVAAPSIAFPGGGNALFQQSVRRALAAARFSPALVDGRPVRVLMAQTFEFRLRR